MEKNIVIRFIEAMFDVVAWILQTHLRIMNNPDTRIIVTGINVALAFVSVWGVATYNFNIASFILLLLSAIGITLTFIRN